MNIVEPEVYISYFKKGPLRVIPEKYIRKLNFFVRSRIIPSEEYGSSMKGRNIGVFLDYKNIDKEKYMHKSIKSIEKYKNQNTQLLILDKLDFLNKDDIKYIEEKTGLKVVNGRKVLIRFVPCLLEELSKMSNQDFKNKDILIISDDTNATRNLAFNLSEYARFLTVIGEDISFIQDISKEVYNEKGLSLFCSNDINKILNNYKVIINLKDDVYIDIKNLRPKTFIFDFSIDRVLADCIEKKRNDIIVVRDLMFLKEGKIIPSWKYELFDEYSSKDFIKFKIGKKYYASDEIAYQFLKLKGRVNNT